MKSKLLILGLLLFVNFKIEAQNQFIKDYRFQQKITISDGSPSSPNVNPIIVRLAEGNGKSPRSTFFTIEFDQVLKVITREPSFVFKIESAPLRLSGDIKYRGFDMSDQLIPDDLRYTLRMKRPNGQLFDVPLTVQIKNGIPDAGSYNDNDTSGSKYSSYEIINLIFKYNNTSPFLNRVNLINNYYGSIDNLDRSFGLLQSIDPENFENFRSNQRNLVECTNTLVQVESAGYNNSLPLSSVDPGRLLEKSRAYGNLLQIKRSRMEEIWRTLHITFYDKAMFQLHKNNVARAKELLTWSLEVNPMFSPALLQLAIIDFKRGDLRESICKADDILFNMPTDPETKQMTYSFLRDVYQAYVERGKQQFSRRDYRKSLDEYEAARHICEKYSQVQCTEQLQLGISASKKGICNEFLNDAKDYIVLNDFDRAELMAREAINYQKENKKDLPEIDEAYALMNSIRQKRYDASVLKAIRLTDQKMFDAALNEFAYNDSLLRTQGLIEAKDIRKYILSAARPRVIELLYEGEAYVRSNQLNEAKERFKRSFDLQVKYNLVKEKDINKHTESLRKDIFSRQCINTQNTVDSAYNEGQAHESDGQYLAADKAYEIGIKAANAFPECSIQIDSLESALLGIRPAVTYLELMQRITTDQENGNYQSAIDNFQHASKYFSDMKVSAFGLNHDPDIFKFIREKGNNGLINYAGDWYREKGELENSLSMYKLLIERNYDVKFLEGALYKLGLRLGSRDKLHNPGSSWKDLVSQYTGGDKKLKRLAKGYKAGFKK